MGAAMKLTSVRSLAIGLLLSGCQVGAELAEDDTSTESVVVRGDGYFTLAHDTRRCVSPICGGYWVSPVNASSLRCVDGSHGRAGGAAEQGSDEGEAPDVTARLLARFTREGRVPEALRIAHLVGSAVKLGESGRGV